MGTRPEEALDALEAALPLLGSPALRVEAGLATVVAAVEAGRREDALRALRAIPHGVVPSERIVGEIPGWELREVRALARLARTAPEDVRSLLTDTLKERARAGHARANEDFKAGQLDDALGRAQYGRAALAGLPADDPELLAIALNLVQLETEIYARQRRFDLAEALARESLAANPREGIEQLRRAAYDEVRLADIVVRRALARSEGTLPAATRSQALALLRRAVEAERVPRSYVRDECPGLEALSADPEFAALYARMPP